jgi:predicted enzyme related to lactoylglutathione lyase
MTPDYDRAYTFIYYENLKTAAPFYRDLLGLREEHESDWVTRYWVTDDYAIGVVQSGRGFMKAMKDKPVILCIGLKDDADIWALYEKLKDTGVRMLTSEVELREVEGRIFFCEDPEGYTVEVVQRPKN